MILSAFKQAKWDGCKWDFHLISPMTLVADIKEFTVCKNWCWSCETQQTMWWGSVCNFLRLFTTFHKGIYDLMCLANSSAVQQLILEQCRCSSLKCKLKPWKLENFLNQRALTGYDEVKGQEFAFVIPTLFWFFLHFLLLHIICPNELM